MPGKRPSVKNDEQYEALKDKGMSKERAAKIANSPGASKKGGENSHKGRSRGSANQGGTTEQEEGSRAQGRQEDREQAFLITQDGNLIRAVSSR